MESTNSTNRSQAARDAAMIAADGGGTLLLPTQKLKEATAAGVDPLSTTQEDSPGVASITSIDTPSPRPPPAKNERNAALSCSSSLVVSTAAPARLLLPAESTSPRSNGAKRARFATPRTHELPGPCRHDDHDTMPVVGVQQKKEWKNEPLKSFIEATLLSSARRAYHKDLLFGMFLRLGKRKLNSIELKSDDSGFKSFLKQTAFANKAMGRNGRALNGSRSVVMSSKKSSHTRLALPTEKNSTSPASTQEVENTTAILLEDDTWKSHKECRKPSHLALLPRALRTLSKPDVSSEENAPFLTIPESSRRQGVAGRSLEELQHKVASAFSKSSIGRTALFQAKNLTVQALKHGQGVQEKSSKAIEKHAGQNPKFAPFTLSYNECSLSTLANWSTQSAQEARSSQDDMIPVASCVFRVCTICSKFGHYEIECKKLTCQSTVKSLSDQISVQSALRNFEEFYPEDMIDLAKQEEEEVATFTTCEVCRSAHSGEALLLCDGCDRLCHTTCLNPPLEEVPDGDWFCSICEGYNSDVSSVCDIEGFEGFVIEQQKRKVVNLSNETLLYNHGLHFTEDGWHSAVAIVKEPPQPDCRFEESRDPSSFPALASGDICWARRQHATAGKLGRDQWWPAVVVQVVKDTRSQYANLTPYLVKLIGVQTANRVRASAVHPFFLKFESFGYNKIHSLKNTPPASSPAAIFQRAVMEAVTSLGCTSLTQMLTKSREENSRVSFSGPSSKLPHTPPPEWASADKDEVDGVTIFSKYRDVASFGKDDDVEDDSKAAVKHRIAAIQQSFKHARLPGCTVAWFPHNSDPFLAKGTQVGTVLATDNERRLALVSPLINWRELLLVDNLPHCDPDGPDILSVKASPTASVLWIEMGSLHVISNGPADDTRYLVLKDILPAQLHLARQMERSIAQHIRLQTQLTETNVWPAAHTDGDVSTHTSGLDSRVQLMDPLTQFKSLEATTDAVFLELPSVAGILNTCIVTGPVEVPVEGQSPALLPPKDSTTPFSVSPPSPSPVIPPTTLADTPHTTCENGEDFRLQEPALPFTGVDVAVIKGKTSADDHTEREDSVGEKDDDEGSEYIGSVTKRTSDDEHLDDVEQADEDALNDDEAVDEDYDDVDDDDDSMSIDDAYNEHGEPATPELEQKLRSQGIYQVEEILDERRVGFGSSGGREYLIKWRGFSFKECTWEPERNILNPNFVRKYKVEKLSKEIKATPEVNIPSSISARVSVALDVGGNKLRLFPAGQQPGAEAKRRLCPFCGHVFQDANAFGGHVKIHSSEPNYVIIREAARMLNVEWYGDANDFLKGGNAPK